MNGRKKLNFFIIEENMDCEVSIRAQENYDPCECFCRRVF